MAGNLLPLLIALPFAAYGVFRATSAQNWFAIEALVSFAVSLVAAYLGVNYFGLVGNERMRKAISRRLASNESVELGWFVGIATPGYMNLWDPHEDIGFLKLTNTHVVFRGETRSLEVPRASIRRISTKPNPHSLLLLGGWIVIDGILDQRPIRLLLEPREKGSLLKNKRKAREMLREINTWAFKK